MNKDDAEKCIELAREAMQATDVATALKWAQKACRLHETAESRGLLDSIRKRFEQASSSFDESRSSHRRGESQNSSSLSGETRVRGASACSPPGTAEDTSNGKSEHFHRGESATYGGSSDRILNEKAPCVEQTGSVGVASTAEATDDEKPRKGGASSSPRQRSGRKSPEKSAGTQEEIVAILEARDLYRVLSVEREASEEELRRAYRRLALRFHPDKNSEPGADAAFKRIAHAFQILSNPERRRIYDQTGIDDEQAAARHQQARARAANAADVFFMNDAFSPFHAMGGARVFATDPLGSMFFGPQELSAEELFEAFFFGGLGSGGPMAYAARRQAEFMARQTPHRRRAYRSQSSNSGFSFRSGFLWQFFPLLLFLLLPYIFSVFAPQPIFQLELQGPYRSERHTAKTKLPYFVRASRIANDPAQLAEIERMVEREWLHRYADSCRSERHHRERLRSFARRAWTRQSRLEYERAADSVSMAACRAYEKLRLQVVDRHTAASENTNPPNEGE